MSTITLHEARKGFQFANRTENKSQHTINWYDMHLARFETWLSERQKTGLAEIATDDVRQFIAHLQGQTTVYEHHQYRNPIQRPLSPYTIRGIVATLSAFFAWSVQEGLIDKDPMTKIAKPKVPKSNKDRFSEEETKKLVEACDKFPENLKARNRAILLFLLSTGVRANELCSLTIDRLDIDHGRAHVTGKGMKDREVYFGNGTRMALWHYLSCGRPPDSRTDRVFTTREGEPIRPDRLQKILVDIGERAGVAHVHPHRFRHTAARLLARNGVDGMIIQKILGHESIETTMIYVKLEREDVEKAAARADPVDRWGLK